MSCERLRREIEHGRKIAHAAGRIWNWESAAGKKRWARRAVMLTSHVLPGQKILELGCGIGYLTKELAKTDAKITAIDISPELLQHAKAQVTSTRILFKLENAYELSFGDSSFDSVLGSSVLHHLEIRTALKECYRVLKFGGTLFFTEPNMLNPQIALQKKFPYLKQKLGDSPDESAFFKWRIRKSLQHAGFVDISVIPFDFLHPAIPNSFVERADGMASIIEKIPLLKEFAGSLYIRARKPDTETE